MKSNKLQLLNGTYMITYIAGLEYREKQYNCKLTGVEKKINFQLSSLQAIDVHWAGKVISLKYPKKSFTYYIINSLHLTKNIHKAFKSAGCGDIIYIRHLSAILPIFCEVLYSSFRKRNYKIVFEINALEREGYYARVFENKSEQLYRKLYFLYSLIFIVLCEKRLLLCGDGVVSVTNEISDHYKNLTKGNLKYLTCGNGIDVSSHKLKLIPKERENVNVLIVATVCEYHGIDRFIRSLHEYESTPEKRNIVLHIVGEGPELPNLKELTTELNLQNRVIFHGFKSGKELDEMFDMCHIALDALAGFRKGLTETSSLKSREYCARGIPFIASSKDADFPDGWGYVQKIPDDETPVDMNTVVDFANRVMADPEHPQKMRAYAEEHLDWMAKMKVLKEFLESL